MKNTKQATSKETLTERNVQNTKFAEFLAKQNKAKEVLEVEKEERKAARKVRSEHFNLKNNVLLLILNSGETGILVSEIIRAKPLQNTKTVYNIRTINRDWNVETPLQYAQNELNESGVEVAFNIEFNESAKSLKSKNNNRIICAAFCRTALKDYLVSKNCKTEWFIS